MPPVTTKLPNWRSLVFSYQFLSVHETYFALLQSAVDSSHKEPVMWSFDFFSLMLAWTNCKTNGGDLSHHDDHVMSLVMYSWVPLWHSPIQHDFTYSHNIPHIFYKLWVSIVRNFENIYPCYEGIALCSVYGYVDAVGRAIFLAKHCYLQ